MRVKKNSSVRKVSTKEKTAPPENEVSRFCEGSFVEIASGKDGNSESWCEAQVATQLSPPATRSRKRKKGGTFIVQYLKRSEAKRSGPLTETAEGKQLRPLPPDVADPIGLHDVVDALVNDGWWEGVVIDVLEESNRFSVLFETPSLGVVEFDRGALRHHLNWDGANWFRTPKKANISNVRDDQRQKQLATPPNNVTENEDVFSSGIFISKKNAGNDFYSLQKGLEDFAGQGSEMAPIKAVSTSTASSKGGIALSQACKKLKTKGIYTPPSCTELPSDMQPCTIFRASMLGNIFENASDAQQSRPITRLRIFDLSTRNEDISAGKDDVTTEQPNNTGIHLGKERTANFSSWEAYSVKGSQNAFRAKALEAFQKVGVMDEKKMEKRSIPDIINDLGSLEWRDETAGTNSDSQAREFEGITHPDIFCISDGQTQKQLATSPDNINTHDVFSPSGSSIPTINTWDESSLEKDRHVKKRISRRMYASLKPSSIMLRSETFRALFDQIFRKPIEMQHRPLMTVDKPSSKEDVSSDKRDEIARKPTDIVVYHGKGTKTSFLSMENSSLKALPSSKILQELEKCLTHPQKGYLTKDGMMKIMTVTSSSNSNPSSSGIAVLDLPDIISDPWILQQRDETPGSSVDTDGQTLPFCKKSPLWKHIELMEAFRAYPQNPHFRPLEWFKDSYREAMAIACMVIFVGLVEDMLELVADVPKSKIENIMEDIVPLENHGFNVAPIKSRLIQLQTAKEDREELLQALVEAKSKVTEQAHAIAETSAELENAVKELREEEEKVVKLKEKVAKLSATEEERVSEMVARRFEADSIEQGILENGIHIQNILLTPSQST